jgi:uncharacterized membrane protein
MKNINIKGLAILIIPLIICVIAYIFLPARIPRQFHSDGSVTYMAKEFIFILGFVPYIIYLRYRRK